MAKKIRPIMFSIIIAAVVVAPVALFLLFNNSDIAPTQNNREDAIINGADCAETGSFDYGQCVLVCNKLHKSTYLFDVCSKAVAMVMAEQLIDHMEQ